MTTIVTRSGKGSALSWDEVDANFTNLNTDKIETTAIGVSVQAHSNNLDTFSSVAPTVAGLALLDDANAAAQRNTLSLGNVDNTSDATKDSAVSTLTNKTITSPKIKAGQFGDSATATNNFTVTAEAADGTMKLARGNAGATTQDIITVDAAGKVAFPNNPAIPVTTRTWQDMTASRSLGGGGYVNNTGQDIIVNLFATSSAGASARITVGGITVSGTAGSGVSLGVQATVPNGATYILSVSAGTGTLVSCVELR